MGDRDADSDDDGGEFRGGLAYLAVDGTIGALRVDAETTMNKLLNFEKRTEAKKPPAEATSLDAGLLFEAAVKKYKKECVATNQRPTLDAVHNLARHVVDVHLERTAFPTSAFAQMLAARLIDQINPEAVVDPGARIEIANTLDNMAWEAVRNAMRGSIDYAAAVAVRGAAVDNGEIRTSDPRNIGAFYSYHYNPMLYQLS